MQAEIITIGTEIIIGSILNTNSQYLSKKLSEIGVHTEYQISLRDDKNEIEEILRESLKRSDIVFVCGGLGPTMDDITKDAVAEVVDKNIIIDEEEYEHLISFFNHVGRTMTENNIRQARVIEGSTILRNHWGLAPGEVVDYDGKKIFLLPGPPKEFCPMVDEYLVKNIKENNNIMIRSINVVGHGESITEDKLRKLDLEDDEISINTFAHFSETEIKIVGEGEDMVKVAKKIDKVAKKIYDEFGRFICSEGDVSANEALVGKLIEKNLTISFAESMTGGLVATNITSVPNASKVLKGSYITYSDIAKHMELGVKEDTLENYGAVSYETSLEMAEGLYRKGICDIAVSITGEAGPVPSEKKVGQTFITFYYGEDNYEVKDIVFTGNRDSIQRRATNYIITHLILKLNK